MFQISLVVLSAVFVIGYIFFSAAAEREDAPCVMQEEADKVTDSDAA